MIRVFSHCCVAIAIVLASLATYRVAVPRVPVRNIPLEVKFDATDLGQLSLGRHEFHVRITNHNSTPHYVLGLRSGCRTNACFLSDYTQPIAIPPGETITCRWDVEIHREGKFEFPIALYLEDHGIREVNQLVRGVGVAPGGVHAPAKP